MSSVLDRITKQAQAEELAARVAYLKLVKQLAAGVEDPTLEEVEAVLDAADMTTAELRKDVARCQSREELRAQVADGAAAQIRKAEIDADQAAWLDEFAEAKRLYNQRQNGVQFELIDITRRIHIAYAASQRLSQSCKDPLIVGRLKATREELDRIEVAIEGAKKRVEAAQAEIHSEEARAANRPEDFDPHNLRRYRNRRDARQQELDSLTAKREPLLQQQRELLAAAKEA